MDKLVRHNILLVIHIAKKYLNQGLPFEDLLQEGLIGLHTAIEKFDLDKGTGEGANKKPLALSTYAYYWIRQGISRNIDNKSRFIRIPIHKLAQSRSIRREFSKFRAEHNCDPSPEELEILIAKAAEKDPNIKVLDAKEIQLLGMMLFPIVHLDEKKSDDENLSMMDYLKTDDDEAPDYITEINSNQELVTSLLAQLTEEEKAFVLIRFGFIDGKSRDVKSMASSLRRMSEAEIIKKINDVLEKLRGLADRDKVNLD